MSAASVCEVELTSDGGVRKRVVVPGTGDLPPRGTTLFCHYQGAVIEEDTSALPDIFIDTRHSSGTPIPFVVGRGDMIKGLEIGLASMTQGERSVFIIQPSYAYGMKGFPPSVPPDATLQFEISVESTELPRHLLSIDQRLLRAGILKDDGNDLYKTGSYGEAVKRYTSAATLLEDVTKPIVAPQSAESTAEGAACTLLVTCLSNTAMAYLKLVEVGGDPLPLSKKAVQVCEKALSLDANNEKVIYRLSQALRIQKDLPQAKAMLSKLCKNAPNNMEARVLFDSISAEIAKRESKERRLYQGMFSK